MWTEHASIFFIFSQTKQFATQKKFKKSFRQCLKNQQTVLNLPDLPCQTVLKFLAIQARRFWIFSAFYSPLKLAQTSLGQSFVLGQWGALSRFRAAEKVKPGILGCQALVLGRTTHDRNLSKNDSKWQSIPHFPTHIGLLDARHLTFSAALGNLSFRVELKTYNHFPCVQDIHIAVIESTAHSSSFQ